MFNSGNLREKSVCTDTFFISNSSPCLGKLVLAKVLRYPCKGQKGDNTQLAPP